MSACCMYTRSLVAGLMPSLMAAAAGVTAVAAAEQAGRQGAAWAKSTHKHGKGGEQALA